MLKAQPALNCAFISYKKSNTHLHITTDKGLLKLQPYSDDIVRITYTKEKGFPQGNSLGVISKPASVQWTINESEDALLLATSTLILHVNKKTCAITYMDSSETILLREKTYDGKTLQAFSSYKTILDKNTQVEKIQTADGIKETVVNAEKKYDKELYHGRLQFDWQTDEALYGMGQHEEGILNLRGHVQYIHQANMKIAMPFLLSSNNYGLLLDTYSPTIFCDNAYGSYLYTEAVEALDYYFIHGENFDKIISGYRTLTGQATMLPRWAFGYMQSFERYESADELVETIESYRKKQIPIDSIVLDWHSWVGEQWGQKSFDFSRFPDPKAMTKQLHELGSHLMVSIWPNMRDSTPNNAEFKEKGGLLQRSELYNAFDPDARNLYWSQAKKGLFDYGIDAWWTDSSEPYAPEWSSNLVEPSKNIMAFHEQARDYLDETHTNAYPLVHGQTIYEGQRSVTSEKRVINLTRSGYTGQQRYGNILWSGDITAKWSTLRKQIPAGLNLCASGLPYWTLDIGAFFVKRGPQWFWDGDYDQGNEDSNYRELYTRWFQYGTFLPIQRSHGTDTRREVWQFGEEGTPYYDAIVKFINLRYKLIPYIYSLAGKVTQEDYTMMRLLAFDFNHDLNVHSIDDQYMFGNALMVCPMTEASTSRNVYLPSNNIWYDYWTGAKYEGGQDLHADAPIDKIPLYVKAGAIIPMAKPMQYTKQFQDNEFDLHIYRGCDGSFTLYLDENDNYNYEKGLFATIELKWNDADKTLHISNLEGHYNGLPSKIQFNIFVNNQALKTVEYAHEALTVS